MSDDRDGRDPFTQVSADTGLSPEEVEDVLGELIMGERYIEIKAARHYADQVRRERELLEGLLDQMIDLARGDMESLAQEERVGMVTSATLGSIERDPGKLPAMVGVLGLAIERLATLNDAGQQIARQRSLEQATPEGTRLAQR